MCGIAGIWDYAERFSESERTACLANVGSKLVQRGPDHLGTASADQGRLQFLHRRLSILDTSAAGHQPWKHKRGDLFVYNGEAFNALEISRSFGSEWSTETHCDTPIVLESLIRSGPNKALSVINGFFALGWWEPEFARLTLARDAWGQKPLYLLQGDGFWAFASTLDALVAGFGTELKPQWDWVGHFLDRGYLAQDQTPFAQITRLNPGSYVELEGRSRNNFCFWTPWQSRLDPEVSSNQTLGAVISEAVKLRLQSDVPVGCFLSGGVDSPLIASYMAELSSDPIATFCMRSSDPSYDEGARAEAYARELGSNHHEIIVDESGLLAVVDQVLEDIQEPFGDSSVVPTWFVCQAAKKEVTVILSGDAGDEMMYGYHRHRWVYHWSKLLASVPLNIRRGLSHLLSLIPLSVLHWMGSLESWTGISHPEEKMVKVLRSLSCTSDRELFESTLGVGLMTEHKLRDGFPQQDTFASSAQVSRWARLHDLSHYLSGNALVKVDRASMSHGLELRAPFLDRSVFAWSQQHEPERFFSPYAGKSPLKELLQERFPGLKSFGPKKGFALPLARWLRSSVGDRLEELIRTSRSQLWDLGDYEKNEVLELLEEHRRGYANHQELLWRWMVALRWLQTRSL